MGGTRRTDAASPANLLLVCGSGTTGCHHHIEAHRIEALAVGLLVAQHRTPEAVPVRVFGHGWVHLTADGTYQPIPQEAA